MFPKRPKNKRVVYLDNAATTPMDPKVISVVSNYLKKEYGNPSTLYSIGVAAKEKMENARKKVADILFTQPDTIIFTNGGTESINLALLGCARKHKSKGKHIITTKVEHHAVLRSLNQLEREGFEVTYLDVDSNGQIDVSNFKNSLRADTVLASIMHANNEIGAILPIADIGREILKYRKQNNVIYPIFHTDACQSGGYLDLNVEKLHVDLMSLNGSKIYGPKGSGVLFKKRGVEIEPIIYGGGQEFGLRPGTENAAGIIGFAYALELVQGKNNSSARLRINKKIFEIRNYFWKKIQENIANVALVGGELKMKERLPNNLNVIFENVDAESLILYLDQYGVMCSGGSACSTESKGSSHVLAACFLNDKNDKNSIRFTFGKQNTRADVDYALKYLIPVVKELRRVVNLESGI